MKTSTHIASVCLATLLQSVASAQVTPIGPFSGTTSESWESFPPSSDPNFLPNLTRIMNGVAVIESTNAIAVYDTGAHGFGLGAYGPAPVADGAQGVGLSALAALATIRFDTPVSRFGGHWGANWYGAGYDVPIVSLTFLGPGNTIVGSDTFTYSGGGTLAWHGWDFAAPVYAVRFGSQYPVLDSLQAVAVPEPSPVLLVFLGVAVMYFFAVQMWSNKSAAPNPARALWFHVGRHRRRVGEPGRYP